MASNCYDLFMPTPCHDEYGDVEIGTYLDNNGFNHDGWSESQCRNYATTHYNANHCTEKKPIRLVQERLEMRSATGANAIKGRLDRSQIKRKPPSTAEEGRRKTNLAIGGAVIMATALGTIGYILGEGTKVGKAGGAMLGVGLPLVGYSLYRASTCSLKAWGCLDVGIVGGLGGIVSGAAIGGAMSSNKVIGGVAGGFVGFFSALIIAKPLIDARRQKQMVRDQY